MAPVGKIDSNVVGLRIAEEQSLGVLPGTPDWNPFEPNTFSDFGGQIRTVAREPINPSRQTKKGVTVDLDSAGGFNSDLTQKNLQGILQGFFFADLRKKTELPVTTVDTGDTTDDYEPASGGTGFRVNDLLFAAGFAAAGNNGLKKVTGTVTATSVPVTSALTPATGQAGTIVHVGHEFATGDAQITTPGGGALPRLITTTKDLTQLGLIPGEWIFIGGDAAGEQFATAANNGFARVRSIATNIIELDKSAGTLVADTGTGKTIRVFFGRVLKNETGTLIKRRTYQLERTLGAPDDAQPTQIQSEYIVGAVPNEFTLSLVKADKVNCDLAFVGTNFETRTGVTGVKTGNRPALVEADAFNASSDVSRVKMSIFTTGTTNPTALFAFINELKLTINNNVKPAKAVGRLGAFDVTAGNFKVNGTVSAYFADVAALAAIRDNSDVTIDFTLVRANAGITFDIPLLSLGDGRLDVKKDEPITLPLALDAATAAKISTTIDYTLFMVFWDYLPNLADV